MLSTSEDGITVFFFNDTATTEIYTLSLHDALPILRSCSRSYFNVRAERSSSPSRPAAGRSSYVVAGSPRNSHVVSWCRSEEHTSELQSRQYLVCRLLLEKKKYA